MSQSSILILLNISLILFLTISSTSSSNLASLSISELQFLIQQRNLPPCTGCTTKRDYVTYLEQLEYIQKIPEKEANTDPKLAHLKQQLDINAQMENILRGQDARQQLTQEKAREYETKLIKGLIHVFAEWILTCACFVGVFFVLSEVRLFYKSYFISLLYIIMLGSVGVASSLGMVKYGGSIVEYIVEYPNGFKQQIVEWIANHMWEQSVVARYHALAASIAGHVMPLLFMCTGRYTLAYSFMSLLLGFGGLELGAAYVKMNPDELAGLVQGATLIQQTLPVLCIVITILSGIHFLMAREKDYRPVATSLLFGCFVLIVGDFILKHSASFAMMQFLDSKLYLEPVDLFHLVLSVNIVVIVMLTRVPGLEVYQETMRHLTRKRDGQRRDQHDETEKPKAE